MEYTPKTFDIPALDGISQKTTDEHLKLYQGYVKHVNLIHEKIAELKKDSEKNAYALAEIQRRLGFEFGGMKNHEAYFAQFEGDPKDISKESELYKSCAYLWNSWDECIAQFKAVALTRGIGWAMLVFDPSAKRLVMTWVDEQHLGQLPDTHLILALDMWEHSYVMDFAPSGKKDYVEAFFKNLNWSVCEERLAKFAT